jgi:hypothetical protein
VSFLLARGPDLCPQLGNVPLLEYLVETQSAAGVAELGPEIVEGMGA